MMPFQYSPDRPQKQRLSAEQERSFVNRMMRDARIRNLHLEQLQDRRSSPPRFLLEPKREDPYLQKARERERREHESDPFSHHLHRLQHRQRDRRRRTRRNSRRAPEEYEDEYDRYERYGDEGSSSSSRSHSEESYSSDFSNEDGFPAETRVQRELRRKRFFERLYKRQLKKDIDRKKREKNEQQEVLVRSLHRSRSQSPHSSADEEQSENKHNRPPLSEKEVDQMFQRLHSMRTHSCSRCSRYRDPLALELEKLRKEKEKRLHYLQERTRRTRNANDSDADEDFDPRKHVVGTRVPKPEERASKLNDETGNGRKGLGTSEAARLRDLENRSAPSRSVLKHQTSRYEEEEEDDGYKSFQSSSRPDRREAVPADEERSWRKRDLLQPSSAERFSSNSSYTSDPPIRSGREPNPYEYPDSMTSSPRRGILKDARSAAGADASYSVSGGGGGVRFSGERRSALTPRSTTEGPLMVPSLRLPEADESPRRQPPSRYTSSTAPAPAPIWGSSSFTRGEALTSSRISSMAHSRPSPPARSSLLGRLDELADD